MSVEVQVVNAFVDGDTGGNPAGVVVDADALTALQKQSIARQVGLSETAFVSASNTATVKLEFFTPTRQIPHCGHATVATFSLLRQRGLIGEGRLSKETIEGDRHILVDGNRVNVAFRKVDRDRHSCMFNSKTAALFFAQTNPARGRFAKWRQLHKVERKLWPPPLVTPPLN